MVKKELGIGLLIAAASFALYSIGTDQRGLIGPDEPRYAAIARTMADSGDWTTPRLAGEPWFEKPALLYWMGAVSELVGFGGDTATRLPVALLSAVFLFFYFVRLRNAFGLEAATFASLVLATSAGWAAFSQAGVFDLPLTATLCGALLMLMEWSEQPSRTGLLAWFGALLGLAVLSKGLAGPAVAAVAALAVCRERGFATTAKALFGARALGAFLAVAGPWYVLCYLENGSAFVDELFWRHHVERLVSDSIQHVQPFWYYLPVIAVGLAPWTPLLFAVGREELRRDSRARFLAFWALATLVVFSLSRNKLPGYVLPALPPLAALIGLRLSRRPPPGALLAASASLLLLFPLTAELLPRALADGLGRAWPLKNFPWAATAAAGLATVAVAGAALRGRAQLSAAVLAATAAAGLIYLKMQSFTALDKHAGARTLWSRIEPRLERACLGEVRRHVAYGLGYYSRDRLLSCEGESREWRVEGDPPQISSSGSISRP